MMGIPGIAQAIMSAGARDPSAPDPTEPPSVSQSVPPLIAAVMNAHAKMASDGIIQKGAADLTEQQATAKPLVIKTTVDPKTGESTSDIKGIRHGEKTIADVQAEAQAPHEQVANVLRNVTSPQETLNSLEQHEADLIKKVSDQYAAGKHDARSFGAIVADMIGKKFGLATDADIAFNKMSPEEKELAGLQKSVAPAVASMRQNEVSKRQAQSLAIQQEKEFKDLTSADTALRYASPRATSDPATAAADKQTYLAAIADSAKAMGRELTPEQTQAASNAFDKAISMSQGEKQAARYKIMRENITPESVGMSDPEQVVKTIENPNNPFTPEERKTALNIAQTKQREWQRKDAKERAMIQLEGLRVASQQRANDLQQAALNFAQDPTVLPKTIAAIEEDPHAYYALFSGPNAKANAPLKSMVDQQLITKYGRIPSDVKGPEHDAILSAKLGLNDLQALDSLSSKWDKAGVPLTGAVVGRINAKEQTWGTPSSIADAARSVAGFSKLTPEQQKQYVEDAQSYANRASNMFVREVKSAASGRPNETLIKMMEPLSLGLNKSGAIRAGASNAIRQEFQNRIQTTRDNAFGTANVGGNQQQATHRFNPATGKIEAIKP